MSDPKTAEEWQHAAKRWEAAHGEMLDAAGRWETVAEDWQLAHDTVAASNKQLRAELATLASSAEQLQRDLEYVEADLSLAQADARHQRQRADHNDRVATMLSRQHQLAMSMLTPAQLLEVTLRFKAEVEAAGREDGVR